MGIEAKLGGEKLITLTAFLFDLLDPLYVSLGFDYV